MSGRSNQKHCDTIAARANGYTDNSSGGVVPPMQPSTTFLRDEAYELVVSENSYGRDDNDQVRLAEQILCAFEGGAESLLFSSGMAAISALIAPLKRGQKVILQSGCYWGTIAFLRKTCAHREIILVEADSIETDGFCELVRAERPALVIVETPSNPWIRTCDVCAISKAVREAGSMLVVDATAATPILMQPLELGADLVMHSATKAINGHSDVLAGVLTCRDEGSEFWKEIAAHRAGGGAILSARDAWMLIRGMRTLPLRVERMCENALAIAQFLDDHQMVDEVWYPGLSGHQDHKLAGEQMKGGYGYLMSFLIKGGRSEALKFCRHLEGIHRATSLGGTESLVEHRHTIEGDLTGCPENLIRLSVGIENKKDLISELDQALKTI